MDESALNAAIAIVPSGSWAVGVSGGADSVALLWLLRRRNDLSLHVVHLDHQTRGLQSTQDAQFVAELSAKWKLPCTVALRGQIEPLVNDLPSNPSARYRAVRLALFKQVVRTNNLAGVILAHHADDQAETVLHRLLRSSSYAGLAGMSTIAQIGELTILRPLLGVRRQDLRACLLTNSIPWREDTSNLSAQYLRNRLRKLLVAHPQLVHVMLELSAACRQLRDWARSAAPVLDENISVRELSRLPRILASESVRRWLIDRGMPVQQIEPAVIQRLLIMAADAASPGKQDFPGGLRLRRRKGMLMVEQTGKPKTV